LMSWLLLCWRWTRLSLLKLLTSLLLRRGCNLLRLVLDIILLLSLWRLLLLLVVIALL
jgi:hypothetical protein